MSNPPPYLPQRAPGRLLWVALPVAAGLGVAAALAAGLVPAARPLLLVPSLLLLALIPVAAHASGQVRRALDGLAREAYFDPLTGIPNRPHFEQALEQTLLEWPEGRTAVLLLDLDRFKDVNDTLGHGCGDDVLRAVGMRLASLEAPGFLLARLGGDRFGLLARDDADTALALAGRALDALRPTFELDGIPLAVGASVGAAIAPVHGDDAETLLRRADLALCAAKRGSSGISLFDPRSDLDEADRVKLGSELGRALEQGELTLVYQPKVSLATGRIVGVETLVRWRHPVRGLLMPAEFVPFAERTGLIRPLSRHVLERAIHQCSLWQTAAAELHVAVNLTLADLVDGDLPTEVAKLLAEAGLPAERLALEVTESSIMGDPFRVRHALLRLSETGVRIAIDDFGVGYTSLGYLKRLPVDELKVDRTFVISMATDANDATIVQSTIDLGRNLGLTVVAEGVETLDALERLKELGCDVAQGYFVGRPAPAEELTELLLADGPITRPARRGPRRLVPAERRPEADAPPDRENPLKLLR